MKTSRYTLFLAISLAFIALFSGCDLFFPSAESGFTVSGSIQASYFNISTPITVTISDGSHTYSTQVNVVDESFSLQSATYSVSGVPAGSYSLVATFASSSYSSSPSFSVDGGLAQFSPYITASGDASTPINVTETIPSLTISASQTIDFDLGNTG